MWLGVWEKQLPQIQKIQAFQTLKIPPPKVLKMPILCTFAVFLVGELFSIFVML